MLAALSYFLGSSYYCWVSREERHGHEGESRQFNLELEYQCSKPSWNIHAEAKYHVTMELKVLQL